MSYKKLLKDLEDQQAVKWKVFDSSYLKRTDINKNDINDMDNKVGGVLKKEGSKPKQIITEENKAFLKSMNCRE